MFLGDVAAAGIHGGDPIVDGARSDDHCSAVDGDTTRAALGEKKKKVQARLQLATKARTTAGTRRDTRLGGATAAGTSACPEWPEAIVRLWVETSG